MSPRDRWSTAWREGAAVDAGYSHREYALTVRHGDYLTTLAGCRFSDPWSTIGRVLRLREVT
jgi:hypothetical protein